MKLLIFIMIGFLFWPVQAREHREPFESILPDDREDIPRRIDVVEEIILPANLVVEGVLWGSERPQAIINGKVYSVGDKIEGFEATLTKIENNVVFISYGGKIFRRTTRTREIEPGR